MSTAIPGAIAGLVAQLRASPADLDVFDGPRPQSTSKKDYVTVGFDDEAGATIKFARSWAGLGAMQPDEEFAIGCSIVVWSGSTKMLDRRTAAFAHLDAVTAAVAADPTLGGAVRLASVLGTGAVSQVQTNKGASVVINFDVECEATISQT